LNNEGTEGNQQMARQVTVVDGTGKLVAVNAISGDMFKHIQAEHLQRIAAREGLPLCSGCQRMNASRIGVDGDFLKSIGKLNNAQILDEVIRRCVLDDLEGNLITAQNKSVGRKSVVEFSWVHGIPGETRTESYFHVRYDPEGRAEGSGEQATSGGQAIFHRPASSGVYATVLNLDLYRAGLNDITLQPTLDDTQRRVRQAALLESVLYTFVHPDGAQRNTQNPHIVSFEGVIVVSRGTAPAPTSSPLMADYREVIHGVAQAMNRVRPGSIEMTRFDSLQQFANAMADLIEQVRPVPAGA
jgi:CRISPR-associated protein Cst2